MRFVVLQKVEDALSYLEKKYQWDEVYLFGSIIQEGRFGRDSDIDIALLGLRKYDYYKFIGEISNLLNTRVDVIRHPSHPGAPSAGQFLAWPPGALLPGAPRGDRSA